MTKYPLFGNDSVPQYTSKFISIIGTVVFWLIFMIVMLCVKPVNKKPKYKEVQIVLSSTPQTVKQPEPVAAPESAPSAVAQPEPVQETITETPAPAKVVETPKSEPKPAQKVEQPKSAPAPKPKAETPKPAAKSASAKPKSELVKKVDTVKQPEPTFTGEYVDPMEAFEAQTQKTQKKEFDWDSFDDSAEEIPVKNEPQKVVTQSPAKSSYSGDAGKVAETDNSSKKSTSTPVNNNKQGTSKGTNTALDAIENTNSSNNVPVKGSAKESDATATTDPNSNLRFANGAARKLLMPKVPKLSVTRDVNFSEVRISFTVDSNGYVVRNSVTTDPPISQSILDEIKDQIGEWWFDSGDGDVTATFIWKIQRN